MRPFSNLKIVFESFELSNIVLEIHLILIAVLDLKSIFSLVLQHLNFYANWFNIELMDE